MNIKMSLYGYGSEYVAGYIPEKIWKYICDECEGDASIYNKKLDDGEVPDEFKLAESSSEYFEWLNDVEAFFDGYAPYSDANLIVCDENDKEIAKINLTNNELNINTKTFIKKPKIGKPYFVWESVEKGAWDVVNEDGDELIEIDGDFDVNKLKIHLDKLRCDNNCKVLEFISSIDYDEENYDISLNGTTGKGCECDFYKDSEED